MNFLFFEMGKIENNLDYIIFEDVDKYIEELLIPKDEVLLKAEDSLVTENIPQISVSNNF